MPHTASPSPVDLIVQPSGHDGEPRGGDEQDETNRVQERQRRARRERLLVVRKGHRDHVASGHDRHHGAVEPIARGRGSLENSDDWCLRPKALGRRDEGARESELKPSRPAQEEVEHLAAC